MEQTTILFAEENCAATHRELSHCRGAVEKIGSNLGPNAGNLGQKMCTVALNKAARTDQVVFLPQPWAQEAPGSNPGAPTIF